MGDRPGLQILVEPFCATLTSDTTGAETAERGVGRIEHAAIDTDGTGPDSVRNRQTAIQVAGQHRPGQPIWRAVGDGDGLVVGIERDDHQHRTEHLLLRDRRVGAHPGDHGRLHVVAVGQVFGQVLRHPTAEDDLGTGLTRLRDHRQHLVLAAAVISGPVSTPGSAGSPTGARPNANLTCSMTVSYSDLCTSSRVLIAQPCPAC